MKTGKKHVDFINQCTVVTRTKYVISKNEKSLERLE